MSIQSLVSSYASHLAGAAIIRHVITLSRFLLIKDTCINKCPKKRNSFMQGIVFAVTISITILATRDITEAFAGGRRRR